MCTGAAQGRARARAGARCPDRDSSPLHAAEAAHHEAPPAVSRTSGPLLRAPRPRAGDADGRGRQQSCPPRAAEARAQLRAGGAESREPGVRRAAAPSQRGMAAWPLLPRTLQAALLHALWNVAEVPLATAPPASATTACRRRRKCSLASGTRRGDGGDAGTGATHPPTSLSRCDSDGRCRWPTLAGGGLTSSESACVDDDTSKLAPCSQHAI